MAEPSNCFLFMNR